MASTRELLDMLEQALSPDMASRTRTTLAQLRANAAVEEGLLLRAAQLAEFGSGATFALNALNEPLAAIKASAERLGTHDDPQVTEQSAWILGQISHLEEVLSHQPPRELQEPGERVSVNLSEVARAAIEQVHHRLWHAKARLVVLLDPQLPKVHGHFGALAHAVANLVANAADAVGAVGGGQVQVTSGSQGREVFLTVSDWGVGIPPEAEPNLFTPLFTTKGAERGTGLGLTVAQRVAGAHGGRIEHIPSPAGLIPPAHTVFRLILPREVPRERPSTSPSASNPRRTSVPLRETPRNIPASLQPEFSVPERRARRRSVLVVDDEQVVRQVLKQLLARDGHEIHEAVNADDALRQLRLRPVDLMVTDKNLPGLDGLGLIQQAQHHHPALRCILITGYPSLASARQGLELGVKDYITKPFDDVQHVRTRLNEALALDPPPEAVPHKKGRFLVYDARGELSATVAELLWNHDATAALASGLEEAVASGREGLAGAVVNLEAVNTAQLERLRKLVHGRPLVLCTERVTWERMLVAIRLGAKACLPRLPLDREALARELSLRATA